MTYDPGLRWTIERPPTDDEWLALRRKYANASTAAVHMRESSYLTVGKWAVEKLTGHGQEQTRPMVRGQRLEAAIREWYADELGARIVVPDTLSGYDRLLCTPDGEIVGTNEGVEIKATHRPGHRDRYWQCIAAMGCAGWSKVHLVELGERDLEVEVMAWDADTESKFCKLIERAREDMGYVELGMVPPDAVLGDDEFRALYPEARTAKVVVPDEALSWSRVLREARQAKREAEQREKEAKSRLAAYMGDAEVAVLEDGREIATWRNAKPRDVIDHKALIASLPEATVAPFRSTVPGARTMRVKGEDE